ncbi:hypothetical protein [Giesbergeria anulus]|uniref:Lipoprotein n=1 Tax=Giesbergeria anulus TaxID=180197 RepID=A0A1H9RV35_9BURK|nr:hypothetical protein [Giesbergeria anulus]SER76295.1 hypothetical protein SAMN02982919_02969 [Giesbergeria anulus]
MIHLKKNIIALLVVSLAIVGCGKTTFNSEDPNSVINMTKGMSSSEAISFIGDAEIAGAALGGQYKLNGYSVDEIVFEAKKAKDFRDKKNILFLKEKINFMRKNSINTVNIHISNLGFMNEPREGYIYKKDYSAEDLEKQLSDILKIHGMNDDNLNEKNKSEDLKISNPDSQVETYKKEVEKKDVQKQNNEKELKELSLAAKEAIDKGFVEIEDVEVSKCTDEKINNIKKEMGDDYVINYSTYNQAAVECGFNI